MLNTSIDVAPPTPYRGPVQTIPTVALRTDDRQAVEALGARLATASGWDAVGDVLLTGLLELVPAVSASYNELNHAAGRAFARIVPEPRADWWGRYQPVFEAHMHENPLVQHVSATGDPRALTWEDVGEVDAFRSTELFRRFYRPLGIESQLAMAVAAPGDLMIAVAINRGSEGFAPRDRAVLDALRPHLLHAHRAVGLATRVRLLEAVIADDGWSEIEVDAEGCATSAPSHLAAQGIVEGAHLPHAVRRAFRAAIDVPSSPAPSPAGPTRFAFGELGLDAVVLPSPVPPHRALVRVRATSEGAHLRALGMSPRQAEVAAAVARGASNREIAASLRIAVPTVKKHLEGVYAALGVSTRAAAVAALAGTIGTVPR